MSNDKHSDPNKPLELQCSCCGFIGESKLFEKGWTDRLIELIYALNGHGITEESIESIGISEQFGTYLYLLHFKENIDAEDRNS